MREVLEVVEPVVLPEAWSREALLDWASLCLATNELRPLGGPEDVEVDVEVWTYWRRLFETIPMDVPLEMLTAATAQLVHRLLHLKLQPGDVCVKGFFDWLEHVMENLLKRWSPSKTVLTCVEEVQQALAGLNYHGSAFPALRLVVDAVPLPFPAPPEVVARKRRLCTAQLRLAGLEEQEPAIFEAAEVGAARVGEDTLMTYRGMVQRALSLTSTPEDHAAYLVWRATPKAPAQPPPVPLVLRPRPCPHCGGGPLTQEMAVVQRSDEPQRYYLRCEQCQKEARH